MTLRYPDDPVDEDFSPPPLSFYDGENRKIRLERATQRDEPSLVEMYLTFDSEDRAQGIPPSSEEEIRKWLSVVMVDHALNVIAWHDDSAVGHTMLVKDSDRSYELAIFVRNGYRSAGIGTRLMRAALGAAQERGIARVWLSVERWNKHAIALYEKLGFYELDSPSFEIEMTIRLAEDEPSE